jgi:hypothetical protein
MNQRLLLVAFFLVGLVAASACAQVERRSSYVTLFVPNSVVVADFNHDGAMDFAVSSYYPEDGGPGIEVFVGNGDGTFKAPAKYVVTNGAGPLAVGDLNHDGNPDLVASSSDAVVVLLGNGDGTFQALVTYATPSAPVSVVLGDFNNDGNLDIATAIQDDSTTSCFCVAVLLGNGDGTFQEPAIVTYPPSNADPLALAAGYFNSDGNLDLALTENFTFSGGAAQILLGNGDGTFTLGASYPLNPSDVAIVPADLRNNGKTDLAVAESGGALAVLLGNGDGTFQQPVEYTLGNFFVGVFPWTVAVGDMKGDGIPDLVTVPHVIANNTNYSAVYIFPGKGDGTFGSPEISFPSAYNSCPRGLALADFNGDHQLDLTFADEFGTYSGVSEYVLLNTGTVKFSQITPLSFKYQKQGTTSPPQTVTLTNEGKASLSIGSIKTAGEFGATSTCGRTVAPKASCTISVTFSPKGRGAFPGTVQIHDSASSKPQVIVLSGKGY